MSVVHGDCKCSVNAPLTSRQSTGNMPTAPNTCPAISGHMRDVSTLDAHIQFACATHIEIFGCLIILPLISASCLRFNLFVVTVNSSFFKKYLLQVSMWFLYLCQKHISKRHYSEIVSHSHNVFSQRRELRWTQLYTIICRTETNRKQAGRDESR